MDGKNAVSNYKERVEKWKSLQDGEFSLSLRVIESRNGWNGLLSIAKAKIGVHSFAATDLSKRRNKDGQ